MKQTHYSQAQANYDYMFQDHSPEECLRWAQSLHYFYFMRAFGGHAGDSDQLEVVFQFSDFSDLTKKLNLLGIALQKIPADKEIPVPGKSYPGDVYATLASPIPQFPEYEQPGHVTINDTPIFCYIVENRLELTLFGGNGDSYSVSEIDVANAQKIEIIIANHPLLVHSIDETRKKREHCLTVRHIEQIIQAATTH
jgi:hypothetical protein